MQRPAFWRVPRCPKEDATMRGAQVGSPSEGELQRGDVIKKLEEYDSRDLRHEDAQNLFKNAGNTITLVVQRDQAQTFSSSTSSRTNSVTPAVPSPLTMNPPPKGGIATPFSMASHSPRPLLNLSAPHMNQPARCASPVVFPPPLPGEEEDEAPQPSYHFQQLQAQSHPPYQPSQSSPTPYAKAAPVNRPVSNLAAPMSTMIRSSSPVVFPPPMPDEVQEIQYLPQGGGAGGIVRPNHLLEYHTQFRATPVDGMHDNYHDDMEIAAIGNQPYRTTPLVLPGAKPKNFGQPTESYLRHHPNPSFRAPPSHWDTPSDVLMKQKVADTVLQRVAADDVLGGKQMVHKQFNTPIGLYSDQNIQDSIQSHTHQGVMPAQVRAPTLNRKNQSKVRAQVRAPTLNRKNQSKVSLKKTVSYDPAKSETFKALQEDQLGGEMTEVTTPAQTKVFAPGQGAMTRRAPGPQPFQNKSQTPAQQNTYVNSLGCSDELIHQSGTFKRLMHQVLGEY